MSSNNSGVLVLLVLCVLEVGSIMPTVLCQLFLELSVDEVGASEGAVFLYSVSTVESLIQFFCCCCISNSKYVSS